MYDINEFREYMDTRDVLDRIDDLRFWKEEDDMDEEEEEELEYLEKFLENLLDVWDDQALGYGITLIREDHFEDYAKEFAYDVGYLTTDNESQWPYSCINWEEAANELLMDYSEVDFNGTTYYGRE